jgi:hypothetical protein
MIERIIPYPSYPSIGRRFDSAVAIFSIANMRKYSPRKKVKNSREEIIFDIGPPRYPSIRCLYEPMPSDLILKPDKTPRIFEDPGIKMICPHS